MYSNGNNKVSEEFPEEIKIPAPDAGDRRAASVSADSHGPPRMQAYSERQVLRSEVKMKAKDEG